ncbi:aspartyl protease family protein [Hymenobacter negativus]|uniref:Aspartyl protease family protein n=1 Tax=Hymenobacter negativus TaxID=2795026 RepID=A0ABS0Q1J8_9BACT|nr:aspartyl protease family protein [Hymenobacter negativus]MBH8556522.1 aspartyl protease family protein [Hymenobacter negativus]
MRSPHLVFLLVAWALCGGLHSPVRAQTGPLLPGPFEFTRANDHQTSLSFQVQRNLLVVKLRLNGAGPYNFLLDSGVGTSIITSPQLADSLRLHHGQYFRVIGMGGTDTGLLAYQTDSVRVELPGAVAPRMSWLVMSEDVLNLSGYVGVPISGILGSELFRSFVVTIHSEMSTVVLNDPTTYHPPRGRRWSSVPLSLENNKAYFTAPVQLNDSLTMPLKLVLDTGASHALSLELDSDPRMAPPAHRLPADLGRGLSGTVRGFLGRVPTLHLGRYALRSVLTSFPDAGDVHRRIDVQRNGNIGYELLKRFSLVIDYPHRRLLLRPNTKFREPFEHDMSGIDLLATGDDYHRFLILRVMPNSPAATAGIEADEELVSVNFLPVNTFSLTQLDRMLHSEDGRVLLLVLRRPDGNLHTASLRLKRQI